MTPKIFEIQFYYIKYFTAKKNCNGGNGSICFLKVQVSQGSCRSDSWLYPEIEPFDLNVDWYNDCFQIFGNSFEINKISTINY